MNELRKLPVTVPGRVEFVDGIAALNPHRDNLVSDVHLSPEGNRVLARALARAISGSDLFEPARQ